MISLEAMISFLAFLCFLAVLFTSLQIFTYKLNHTIENFQRKVDAENYAFLIDSIYNCTFIGETDFNISFFSETSQFLANKPEVFDLPTRQVKVSKHYG